MVPFIAVAAAVATTAGIGAYLNAKYHIAKDLRQIYAANRGQKRFDRAGELFNFLIPHHFQAGPKGLT
jgi:hypothetical protein